MTQWLVMSLNVAAGPAQTMLHGCIHLDVCKHAVCACVRKHCISIAMQSLQDD